MENIRKAKIQKYFDEIVTDKADLNELLDRIINKVFSCVQNINRADLSYKDLVKIQNFELSFLQKLGELTCELETLEEDCPIDELNIQEIVYYDEPVQVAESMQESLPQVEEPVPEEINPTDIREEPTHDYEISERELQNIRKTLKFFSSKLGVNLQNMSSMSNYYAKPSRSSNVGVTDIQMPNSSVPLHGDVNNITDLDSNVGMFDVQIPSSSGLQLEEHNSTDLDSDHIPEKDVNPNLINVNVEEESIEQTTVSNTPNDSAEDLSSMDAEVQSLAETPDFLTFEVPNNGMATKINTNEPCTAIQKLNNLKLKDYRADIKPLELPDLTLVPTGSKTLANSDGQNTMLIRNFETQNKKKINNLAKTAYFDLKPKDVPTVGTMCMFSHVETPTNFYIHIADTESIIIDSISDNIKKYAHSWSRYKSREEAHKDIHRYGVVYIPNFSNWYRMEVLDWYEAFKHANVLIRLVDYGSTHIVSYTNLGKLNEDLASIPMLAIRCHFPIMYPPNSTASNKLALWPQDSLSAFMELSGLISYDSTDNNLFSITYAYWDEELNSLSVDLYNVSNGNEENTIGQILINLGLAVQIGDEDDEEEEPELEEFLQDVDTLELADNINEAITGYDARDEARICRFTKRDGTCYKGKHCKLEHIPLPKDDDLDGNT